MSNFPCSCCPILTTLHIHFSLKGWENVLFELGSERVKRLTFGEGTLFLSGEAIPQEHKPRWCRYLENKRGNFGSIKVSVDVPPFPSLRTKPTLRQPQPNLRPNGGRVGTSPETCIHLITRSHAKALADWKQSNIELWPSHMLERLPIENRVMLSIWLGSSRIDTHRNQGKSQGRERIHRLHALV